MLDALEGGVSGARIRVFTVDGAFVTADEARAVPLDVAAANWMATAMLVARRHPDAFVIDSGTTTTDVIPIVSGRVAAAGRTDLDRLTTGELLYTGAVRTPVEAIVRHVEVGGRRVAVSTEGFALSGDVHSGAATSRHRTTKPPRRTGARRRARSRASGCGASSAPTARC